MQVETKYLRLCQPAALGEQIDSWKVYWVGGWGRDRLFFYVMVGRGEEHSPNAAFAKSWITVGLDAYRRRSDDTDLKERWCDNIEEEHRWREYEKARIVVR